MDISEIWGAHLRAIVDAIAPGDASVRGLKRPAFKEVAARTRKSPEYVYQVYSGIKRVGADFASTLDREFSNGRPTGWINAAPQELRGAADEPARPDTPEKQGGLALNEFLNYLNARDPRAPLTPDEVIEEAEAYREYVAQRLTRRLLKRDFLAPEPVPDSRVEAAFSEAQRRERQAGQPSEQLVTSPLAKGRKPRGTKKSGAS